jgi:hypothetical protein
MLNKQSTVRVAAGGRDVVDVLQAAMGGVRRAVVSSVRVRGGTTS